MSTLKMLASVLLVVGVAGVVNAATPVYEVSDNFNNYGAGRLNAVTDYWYSGSGASNAGASVVAGIGVDGTNGVNAHADAAIMSRGDMREANKVVWGDLAVGNYVILSMDFKTSALGHFDDDRLFLSAGHSSVDSAISFGVQLDFTHNILNSAVTPADYAFEVENNKVHIETYYRVPGASNANRLQIPFVTDITVASDAWYTFTLILTKTGDVSALFDVSLATLGGDVIASGTWNTLTDSVHQPNASYFDELWPAYKNYLNGTAQPAGVGADNFYFAVVPEPMTLGLLGLGSLALLRRRKA